MSEPFHVQAHRGASADLLENTLPAFQRAMELGVTSIELDIHVTKDGRIVVAHDFALHRKYTKDAKGKPIPRDIPIRTLTLAELRTYDVVDERRLKSPPTTQTVEQRRIPTLEEVFELANRMPGKFVLDIEIKSDPRYPLYSPPPAEFAEKLVNLIRAHWRADRVIVRSFDHRTLKEVRKREPGYPIAALTEGNFKNYTAVADDVRPEILAPYKGSITKKDVQAMHARGIQVIPYTANTEADWKRLIAMGVDGITTDDPAELMNYLASQGIPCAPEYRALPK